MERLPKQSGVERVTKMCMAGNKNQGFRRSAGKGTIHRDRQMDRQKGTGGRGEIWENERRRETML